MKRLILLIAMLPLLGVLHAQEQVSIKDFLSRKEAKRKPYQIKGAFQEMVSVEDCVFSIRDGNDSLLVGLPRNRVLLFWSMNVLPGDTLTVLGERGKLHMKGRKAVVGIPSAGILSHVVGDRQKYYSEIKDQPPSFMGGGTNFFTSWVDDHLCYPPESKESGSQGTVVLSFTLETDGSMGAVFVLQTSGDRALDREAVRVVSRSPAWSPGIMDGRPIRVTYTFPVIFKLY